MTFSDSNDVCTLYVYADRLGQDIHIFSDPYTRFSSRPEANRVYPGNVALYLGINADEITKIRNTYIKEEVELAPNTEKKKNGVSS